MAKTDTGKTVEGYAKLIEAAKEAHWYLGIGNNVLDLNAAGIRKNLERALEQIGAYDAQGDEE